MAPPGDEFFSSTTFLECTPGHASFILHYPHGVEMTMATETKDAERDDQYIHRSHSSRLDIVVAKNEDELRLAKLGYKQEVKRIFTRFTNFGLAMSMISVILGIIPLYGYSLRTGGPVVMVWGWLAVGLISLNVVCSLAEICSAYPTMGALYYWACRLGGPKYGPVCSWMAGWFNLLGQVAGVASGGWAGAQVMSDVIFMCSGHTASPSEIVGLFAVMLTGAGIANTFGEHILPVLCYFSVAFHIIGVIILSVWTRVTAPEPHPSATFVLTEYHNETGFSSWGYVSIIGLLAAASTFTGYDTAAHVAEETHNSHQSTPHAMVGPVVAALVMGELLIISFNSSISDLGSILQESTHLQPYTLLWEQTAGRLPAIIFNLFVLVCIELSNCANLTSASRMVYSFSRDRGLPGHHLWYRLHEDFGGPVRAIWLCVFIAFCLGLPGLINESVLAALFSLTATGLYASYIIPIFLRVTVARNSFKAAEWNLGRWSLVVGWISVVWIIFITIVLCCPVTYPINVQTMNYSPLVLLLVIAFALGWWLISARRWFQGPRALVEVAHTVKGELVVVDKSLLEPKEAEELEAVLQRHSSFEAKFVETDMEDGEKSLEVMF